MLDPEGVELPLTALTDHDEDSLQLVRSELGFVKPHPLEPPHGSHENSASKSQRNLGLGSSEVARRVRMKTNVQVILVVGVHDWDGACLGLVCLCNKQRLQSLVEVNPSILAWSF